MPSSLASFLSGVVIHVSPPSTITSSYVEQLSPAWYSETVLAFSSPYPATYLSLPR